MAETGDFLPQLSRFLPRFGAGTQTGKNPPRPPGGDPRPRPALGCPPRGESLASYQQVEWKRPPTARLGEPVVELNRRPGLFDVQG